MSARSRLRAVVAGVEREVSRLATVQGTGEAGTERGRGAAWSKLVGLQSWARSPGIARDRYGASAAFALLRGAAVLDQGLAGRRLSARPPRRRERRGALEPAHVIGNGAR